MRSLRLSGSDYTVLVEVVGVEPTSYSAAKALSTYLFRLFFLREQRGRTRFTRRRKLNNLLKTLPDP